MTIKENKTASHRVKEAAARTKRALAKAEVKTDSFLMRFAASPYTFGAVVVVVATLLVVWVW